MVLILFSMKNREKKNNTLYIQDIKFVYVKLFVFKSPGKNRGN